MLRVHSIESLGTYDGPGLRLVVFLQGCNFKCLYCANPDTIEYQAGTEYTAESILKMAESQRSFFGKKGGVTISGGEPLLQAKELIELFKLLKENGFNTCIDTNGSVFNESVQELMDYTDLVLLDIKQMNAARHKQLTGTTNSRTLQFSNYLAEKNIPTWIRYVLVPDYSNDEADMHALGKHIQTMSNVKKLEIQPYHKLGEHKYEVLGWDYQLTDVPTNTAAQLATAKAIFGQYVEEVIIN